MKVINNYSLLLIIFLSVPFYAVAQDETPLTVHHKTYAKGGSVVVGNTILGEHKTNPFNSDGISNDAIKMVYVDVDDDEDTFSSSSANVTFPEGTTNILYAGLYWSGLYPAEKSSLRIGNQHAYFTKKGKRDEDVASIKIKFDDKKYIKIKGKVVYDAKGEGEFKKYSPYVCRADVTKYFKRANFNGGNFTAANIRATRGQLQGGSAAGWHLYIIYENPNNTPKYFTTYDGFRQVKKKPIEIVFSDFQTKTLGKTESTLIMATLEGDEKISSDHCAIFDPEQNRYVRLETANRKGRNFFSSGITIYSEMFLDRNPPSKNTLGFDLLKMKLAEGLISNKAEEAQIGFKSKDDVFFLYFIAFETEIEEDYMLAKNAEEASLAISNELLNTDNVAKKLLIQDTQDTQNVIIQNPERVLIAETDSIKVREEQKAVVINISEEKITPKKNTELVIEAETAKPLKVKKPIVKVIESKIVPEKPRKISKYDVIADVNTIKRESSNPYVTELIIDGIPSGFYLITNVFSEGKLAQEWTGYLMLNGLNPQQFVNPLNGWIYVYLLKGNTFEEVSERQTKLERIGFLRDMWIAGVNR